jgi:hypothetical protein
MKNKTIVKTKKDINNQQDVEFLSKKNLMINKPTVNAVHDEFAVEGHEDFYSYLEWLGLAKQIYWYLPLRIITISKLKILKR